MFGGIFGAFETEDAISSTIPPDLLRIAAIARSATHGYDKWFCAGKAIPAETK
jgi:hypothetical protein